MVKTAGSNAIPITGASIASDVRITLRATVFYNNTATTGLVALLLQRWTR